MGTTQFVVTRHMHSNQAERKNRRRICARVVNHFVLLVFKVQDPYSLFVFPLTPAL
jgi:hypothetical protein